MKVRACAESNLTADDLNAVKARAKDPNYDRLRFDMWENFCAWQRFLWSDGTGVSPLRQGVPVPCSSYVEMAFEAMGMDLVPGASERNSAPEHIWNAARWWYQEADKQGEDQLSPYVITGCYAIRDAGGSISE